MYKSLKRLLVRDDDYYFGFAELLFSHTASS